METKLLDQNKCEDCRCDVSMKSWEDIQDLLFYTGLPFYPPRYRDWGKLKDGTIDWTDVPVPAIAEIMAEGEDDR